MSTHPTAEEIAREAVQRILDLPYKGIERDHMNCSTAIILTAARRIAAGMVRDSGAVEALEAFNRVTIEGHGLEEAFEKQEAAIAKLKAITEQP